MVFLVRSSFSKLARYASVVLRSVCPKDSLIYEILTPLRFNTVAYECLAVCNRIAKASDSEQVKIKRKPLEISDISVFCEVEKMQMTTEY